MATTPKTVITPEEYLAIDRAAERRSEYFRGEMFAMAGASVAHNRIVTNLVRELSTRLRKTACEVFSNDMRLQVASTGAYTYPDVMVVCGSPQFADQRTDTVLNPVLIIEVLSESTADYDQGGKFHKYMRIPALREYLTISQTEILIDQFVRQPDNGWLLREIGPADQVVSLRSIDVELKLADIYEKVIAASST